MIKIYKGSFWKRNAPQLTKLALCKNNLMKNALISEMNGCPKSQIKTMLMKKYLIPLLVISLIWGCKKEIKTDDTPKEMVTTNEDGWTNLFDGKSFDGWHTYLQDTISDQWQIEDGVMFYKPDPDKIQGVNNLVTDKTYKNYELSLDWKISVDGNSGVFYGVLEDEKFVVPYMTAPEIQIRDYTNIEDFNDHQQMSPDHL